MNQIHKGTYNFSKDMVAIYQEEDIENQIQSDWENIDKVAEASVLIDKPKNMLIYENDTTEGILVNVSSRSIQQLYNKFLNQGLFDMNIRKFVSNKMVDKGINDSLVLVDQLAFIVNIPNHTVVTAMNQTEADESIFTNIDGAVII